MKNICIDCNKEFDAYRKDNLRCPVCKKKRKSYIVMLARKKKHPEIEMGVGSGNSYKNKHQPLTHNTYVKVRKDRCEWCGATNNLLVHHLDENRNNNDISNLVTLCKRCHQNYHTKRDMTTGRYMPK